MITGLVRIGCKVNWGSWSADVEGYEYSELLCSFGHFVDLNRWVEDSVEFYLGIPLELQRRNLTSRISNSA